MIRDNILQKKIQYFIFLSLIGFSLRLIMSNFGIDASSLEGLWDSDVEAFQTNLELMRNGKSFYEPGHFNYSPIWLWICNIIDSIKIPLLNNTNYEVFRIKIIILLSLVDLIIFYLLFKNYNLKIGLLFYLNPVSIIITGVHNQFDNFAILIGFVSILFYEKSSKDKINFLFSLFLLGLSLALKHILFLFPIWLAIKEKKFYKKILIILIPVFIFIISFFPYLFNDFQYISQHVFNYISFNNGPFWGMFTSKVIDMYIPRKYMFILILIIAGLFFEKKSPKISFYYYLLSVVIFSSSLAIQYLTIPLIAIAVFWNSKYFIYCLLCIGITLVSPGHFHIEELRDLLNWNRISSKIALYPIIFFLMLGFIETIFGKKKINKIFKNILIWFKIKIKTQLNFKN